MKEKELQKLILEYVRLKGCTAFKMNSTGIYNQARKQYIPLPRRGISDIIGCTKTGQFFAIEVKSAHGKPTFEQEQFLQEVREHKGIAILAYSLEDVSSAI